MNKAETKIVAFKNCGHQSIRERWKYGVNDIEIVSSFTNVGVYFTNWLSLYKISKFMGT